MSSGLSLTKETHILYTSRDVLHIFTLYNTAAGASNMKRNHSKGIFAGFCSNIIFAILALDWRILLRTTLWIDNLRTAEDL